MDVGCGWLGERNSLTTLMRTYEAGNMSVNTLAIITVVTSTSSKHPFFILNNTIYITNANPFKRINVLTFQT